MMHLKGIAIASHPPAIVPGIDDTHLADAEKTIRGMKDLALEIAKLAPKTIICITPHGNVFADGISVLYEPKLTGDFGAFGAPNIKMTKECDMGLLDTLNQTFAENDCHSLFINPKTATENDLSLALDHGVMVPLYYIDKAYPDYKIIHITIGELSLYELYRTGRTLREAIEVNGKDTVILASADLSHCLKDDGPYDYNAMGDVFDTTITQAIEAKDYYRILTMEPKVYEPAGQCGLRPIVMALGATDRIKTNSKVLSYEGPFGVGYMEAWITFNLEGADPTNESLLERFEAEHEKAHAERVAHADPIVALAMQTVDTWVKEGRSLNVNEYVNQLTDKREKEKLSEAAGVFITINKSGELRGCIGTIRPVTENLAREIVRNSIEASTYDPRFLPIEEAELNQLEISVSIMGEPEDVEDISELDPNRYGVIAEKGLRRGVLLPNLTGIDTVEQQIAAVKRKAAISEFEEDNEIGERLHLMRFAVEYHGDDEN